MCTWENELDIVNLNFFTCEIRITVLATVNIKCVTLKMSEWLEYTAEVWRSGVMLSEEGLKRTVWEASGEPTFFFLRTNFWGQYKCGET